MHQAVTRAESTLSHPESAFGACCPSVASLAWSLAVAGMPGSADGVFRVLAGVSGIGGECFSWMGGRQQCGDRVAAHLGAGRTGGDTTRMCQWSGTALWARRNWRQR